MTKPRKTPKPKPPVEPTPNAPTPIAARAAETPPVSAPPEDAQPRGQGGAFPHGHYGGRMNSTTATRPTKQHWITAGGLNDEVQEWLWRPFVPCGGLTLFTGETGAGKSTILAAVAAGVSAGRNMDGRGGFPPGRVVYYAAEDDYRRRVKPRLEVAMADMSRVLAGDIGPDQKRLPRMALPRDMAKLTDQVQQHGITLLILDPITSYLSDGIDVNKDQTVASLLEGLQGLSDSTGCTVIYSKNYRKGRDGGPLEWVGGAAKWTSFPRVVVACGYDPDDRDKRVMTCSKNSLEPQVKSKRYLIRDVNGVGQWNGGADCDLSAEDLGLGGMAPGDRDALGDAEDYLLDALSAEERRAADLVVQSKDAGIALGTLRRAKAKLAITSHLVGTAGDRYMVWRLPAQDLPASPD